LVESNQGSPFVEERGVSKRWWLVLGTLGLVALAIPFVRDPVLFEDDFSGPEVLRVWPDDGAVFVFSDGAYQLNVLSSDSGSPTAINDLPRSVGGIAVAVEADVLDGEAAFGADCISDYREHEGPDGSTSIEETAAYALAVDPSGAYVIFGTDGPLDQGMIAGDTDEGVTFECIGGESGTTLRIRAGDNEPSVFIDDGGYTSFRAFGLAAYAESVATVAFDQVTVRETSNEEST
jgi:hypothetical protein